MTPTRSVGKPSLRGVVSRRVGWCVVTLGIVHGIPGPAETTTGKRRPTRDDFLVRGLEKIVPAYDTFDGTMYAGLLSTTPLGTESSVDAHGEFMFWLFEPHHALFDDRLLIWNNGGPGCSSLGGCLFEHCPVVLGEFPAGYERIDPHTPLQSNTKWAWTNASPMLYVEQPHGTGFSTGTFPHNETEMARDFYGFLRNFYDVFDNYASQQLFLAGESYGTLAIRSRQTDTHPSTASHNLNLLDAIQIVCFRLYRLSPQPACTFHPWHTTFSKKTPRSRIRT